MNVSACLVTRGDVDLESILASLPMDDVVIWDNSKRQDLTVYGRYAAIAEAKHDLIYVQDDDCVLEPNAIKAMSLLYEDGKIISNMPEPFRHTYYQRHCLVGFGAIFHRMAPSHAFDRFCSANGLNESPAEWPEEYLRTSDVIFTALTPYALVDLPYRNLPWATANTRMYRQSGHVHERKTVLNLALRSAK